MPLVALIKHTPRLIRCDRLQLSEDPLALSKLLPYNMDLVVDDPIDFHSCHSLSLNAG